MSCGSNEKKLTSYPKATVINIDTTSIQYSTNIDTLIDSLRFVRLESNSENIVGEVAKVEFLNRRIIVFDRRVSNAVFIFDENGGLLKKLKSSNENHIGDFTIANGNIVLFLDFTNEFVVFNQDGDFLSKERAANKMYSGSLAATNQDTYIFWNNVVTSSIGSYRMLEYDLRSQRFNNGFLPFDPGLSNAGGTFNPTPFNSIDKHKILVSQPLDDTIYTFDFAGESPQLYPKFILNFQRNPLPKSFNNKISAKVKLAEAYKEGYSFYLSNFADLTSIVSFSYYDNNSYMTYIWDKENRKSLCNSLDVMIEKLNLKLPQKLLQIGKDKMVGVYPAYEIVSWAQKQKGKNKNVLSSIAKEISPIDNPILVIIDFKK